MPSQHKRVENAIHGALQQNNKVLQEITAALDGPRTGKEIRLLESVRENWSKVHRDSFSVYEMLIEGVRS